MLHKTLSLILTVGLSLSIIVHRLIITQQKDDCFKQRVDSRKTGNRHTDIARYTRLWGLFSAAYVSTSPSGTVYLYNFEVKMGKLKTELHIFIRVFFHFTIKILNFLNLESNFKKLDCRCIQRNSTEYTNALLRTDTQFKPALKENESNYTLNITKIINL